jgi:hypothetical protein
MGKPVPPDSGTLREERAPGELKHLSSPRKRKDSASSGERKRKSLNRCTCTAGLKDRHQRGERKSNGVGKPTRDGESPVDARSKRGRDPEYRGAR